MGTTSGASIAQPQQWPAPGLVSRQAWLCEMGHRARPPHSPHGDKINRSDSKCEYVNIVKMSTRTRLKPDLIANLHASHLTTTVPTCYNCWHVLGTEGGSSYNYSACIVPPTSGTQNEPTLVENDPWAHQLIIK